MFSEYTDFGRQIIKDAVLAYGSYDFNVTDLDANGLPEKAEVALAGFVVFNAVERLLNGKYIAENQQAALDRYLLNRQTLELLDDYPSLKNYEHFISVIMLIDPSRHVYWRNTFELPELPEAFQALQVQGSFHGPLAPFGDYDGDDGINYAEFPHDMFAAGAICWGAEYARRAACEEETSDVSPGDGLPLVNPDTFTSYLPDEEFAILSVVEAQATLVEVYGPAVVGKLPGPLVAYLVIAGGVVNLSAPTQYFNYEFDGWQFVGAASTNKSNPLATSISRDTTVYPVYRQEQVVTYTVEPPDGGQMFYYPDESPFKAYIGATRPTAKSVVNYKHSLRENSPWNSRQQKGFASSGGKAIRR
ncbi:MAG: hypothetical protein HC888_04950 [Candidatus Competibacteraceae bacterium]|nr:hypothetical protein [Candidatus Competibacteraceae bacterium]